MMVLIVVQLQYPTTRIAIQQPYPAAAGIKNKFQQQESLFNNHIQRQRESKINSNNKNRYSTTISNNNNDFIVKLYLLLPTRQTTSRLRQLDDIRL